MASCWDDLESTYFYVFGSIALWMLSTIAIYRIVLKELMEGAPSLAAQFFASFGVAQLSAVGFAVVFFMPPDCDSWLIYVPPVAEAVFFLKLAWNQRAAARRVSSDDVNEAPIFSKLPGVELTEHSEESDEEETF